MKALKKERLFKFCLTCNKNIEHKHLTAKYCNYTCYWNSTNQELTEKRRNAAKNGMLNYNKTNGVWNRGLTTETSTTLKVMGLNRMAENNPYNKAIADGRTSVYLKDRTYDEVFGKKKSAEIKNKIRKSVAIQYSNGKTRNVNTAPELEFKILLESNNIKFKQSFFLENKIYDFFLPKYNTLVEVDGVYWHGKGVPYNKLNTTQLKNYKNDKLKNKIAINNNHTLIRIWEGEIDKFDINKLKIKLHDNK